jgi:DNA-binding winged helix-turn-helix (wHTH) protein
MDDITDRSQFRIGDLLVVPDRLIVVRDGQEISLEPRMMEVLMDLAENASRALSTAYLMQEIWGSDVHGDNPVNKTISILRKLIGDDARNPRYIETVPRLGYRLIAPVSFPDTRPRF